MIKLVKPKLTEVYGFNICFQGSLYTAALVVDDTSLTTVVDEQTYTVVIAFSKSI